jgi:hypothetical protein
LTLLESSVLPDDDDDDSDDDDDVKSFLARRYRHSPLLFETLENPLVVV